MAHLKHYILIFGMLASACTLSAQYDCLGTLPDSMNAAFMADAEQLALRYVYAAKLEDTNRVDLTNEIVNTPLAALHALYLTPNLPHWEEIFVQYDIHALETIPNKNVELTVDTSIFWVSDWLAKPDNPFGNGSTAGNLLASYGFVVGDKLTWIFNETTGVSRLRVLLTTDQPLNLNPLLKVVKQIEGVIAATAFAPPADFSSDISFEVFGNYVELVFQYNWDCENNTCNNHHYWHYRVYDDCTVEFVDDFGELLPVYNIPTFLSTGVYPNPTVDEVSFTALGPPDKDIQVLLFSALGQIIQSEIIRSNTGLVNLTISLKNLPVGLYFLGLSTGETVLTEKILKR